MAGWGKAPKLALGLPDSGLKVNLSVVASGVKLRDFLVANETFSDFLHWNTSLPRFAVDEILNSKVNLERIITSGYQMRMKDLCNSTKLSEFLMISNPAVAMASDALICLMPKDKLASAEKVFQANLDIVKPFMWCIVVLPI
uniref:Uncharacterized protein n=1 Tax=Sphaerodactylus townsendi TaxID=933632 RepID=A0ACB8ESS1_9SAUR